MKIHNSQIINAPADKIWAVFGGEFADIYRWASFVDASEAKKDGSLVGDSGLSGRVCETKIGKLDEQMLIFKNDTKELKFRVLSDGFPFFLKSIESHWRFYDQGEVTRAETNLTLDVSFPFNYLIGWSLKRNFRSAVNDVKGEMEAHLKERSMI